MNATSPAERRTLMSYSPFLPARLRRAPAYSLLLLLLAACVERADRAAPPSDVVGIDVATGERRLVHAVGADTLSDAVAITRVVPEPDGDAVAIVFADASRRVSAGLALVDPPRGVRLVWPDSVGAVWWSGPHRLAFQSATGTRGVHAVVDVHADTLRHVEAAHDTASPAPRSAEPAGARARATAYIDSLRVQPEGTPERGALRYTVTRVVPAPGDSLVAFYVVARGDGEGERLNPAWYVLDVASGHVASVDSITGPARTLPEEGAAWTQAGRFIYAKGASLAEARITRRRQ